MVIDNRIIRYLLILSFALVASLSSGSPLQLISNSLIVDRYSLFTDLLFSSRDELCPYISSDHVERFPAMNNAINISPLKKDEYERKQIVRKTGAFISLGVGIASGTAAVFLNSASNRAYEEYKKSTITQEVIDYREKVMTYRTFTAVFTGVSVVSMGFSAYFIGVYIFSSP